MESEVFKLCVVVPVSRMANKLNFFKEWAVEAQNHSIFIVVVHDWRDVETENELKDFLHTLHSERYLLLSAEYGSPGYARNAGMKKAIGEWIAFWDSDDLPNLEAIFCAIRESSASDEVLIGNFEKFNPKNHSTISVDLGLDWRQSVSRNPGLWRMIIRRNTIGQTTFADLLMAEDQLFLIQYQIFDRQVKLFHKVFYSYQMAQDTQATSNQDSLTDLIRSLELTRKEIGLRNPTQLHYYQRMYVMQTLAAFRHLRTSKKIMALLLFARFAKEFGFGKIVRITLGIFREE